MAYDMPIRFAAVTLLTDRRPIASHIAVNDSYFFSMMYDEKLKKTLQRVARRFNFDKRTIRDKSVGKIHYEKYGRYLFVAICESWYSQRLALKFLRELRHIYFERFGDRLLTPWFDSFASSANAVLMETVAKYNEISRISDRVAIMLGISEYRM